MTMRFTAIAISDLRKKKTRRNGQSFNSFFSLLVTGMFSTFFLNDTPSPAVMRSLAILTSITYVSLHMHNDIDINNE